MRNTTGANQKKPSSHMHREITQTHPRAGSAERKRRELAHIGAYA